MSRLRIQCSPITGTIYAGRINKAGDAWSGGKHDVTSDVLGAVIQKIGVGNTITVNVNGVPAFDITVSASPSQSTGDSAAEQKEPGNG